MDWNILKDIGVAVGIPVARSFAGWLKHALEDKKVSEFELKLLGSTVIRVGTVSVMMYLGLNGMGFDVSVIGASASAFVIDLLLKAFRSKK